MSAWTEAFIIIAAIAVTLQMVILLALFLEVRSVGREVTRRVGEVQKIVEPILLRVHGILESSHEKITGIVSDTAEITAMARGQAQKLDRVLTDAADRLNQQIIRADQMVTGVMALIEEAGIRVRRSLWSPLGEASAVIRGIKAGFEVMRGRRRSHPAGAPATQDEELFI